MSQPDGAALIAAERQRQRDEHGFDDKRDDRYTQHELVDAAMHYANPDWSGVYWPSSWDRRFDQKARDDRTTQLVKAGALIAAEIDRLQRASEAPRV